MTTNESPGAIHAPGLVLLMDSSLSSTAGIRPWMIHVPASLHLFPTAR
jgi:hypothetical protein